jgi:hypothetical protein
MNLRAWTISIHGPGMVEAVWNSVIYRFAHWDLQKIYYHLRYQKYMALASGEGRFFTIEG